MKSFLAGLAAMALTALAGCTQGTPGGPGTTDATSKKPAFGQADDTFNLTVPVMTSSLQQGETKTVSIGIKRDASFDQDVALTFGHMPTGVTLEPNDPVIKHGDEEAQLTLSAAEDAALGNFTIKVTGHPAKGADAATEFKLTVVKE